MHLIKVDTFDVANLYTMIPRQGALEASIRMARLVVDTNYFSYQDKYYLQIRSGAKRVAFIMTLANIDMWEWEQSLIKHQHARDELHGPCASSLFDRYIDNGFMTTHLSSDQIKAKLKQRIRRIEIFESNTKFKLVSNSLTWLSVMTTSASH
jgi:hypothetical protein